jgi:putative hydrolase of the HAD superfamily
MTSLSTIAFDADDTLWQSEQFYKATEQRFAELLETYAEAADLSARLLNAERRNIGHYGYGIKGFTLSMIETAIEVTDGKVATSVISELLETGREMLAHPIEIFPHAREILQKLSGMYRLLLITKGDLLDQERKLAQSGLDELFDRVEIVSNKSTAVYSKIFTLHGDGPERSMMVGNSLRSDILPALKVGSWGVHIPHDLTWVFENCEIPAGAPRFKQLANLGELENYLAELE